LFLGVCIHHPYLRAQISSLGEVGVKTFISDYTYDDRCRAALIYSPDFSQRACETGKVPGSYDR
jgi:hypothetical protein